MAGALTKKTMTLPLTPAPLAPLVLPTPVVVKMETPAGAEGQPLKGHLTPLLCGVSYSLRHLAGI
jgi:hypothetical protein